MSIEIAKLSIKERPVLEDTLRGLEHLVMPVAFIDVNQKRWKIIRTELELIEDFNPLYIHIQIPVIAGREMYTCIRANPLHTTDDPALVFSANDYLSKHRLHYVETPDGA